MYQFSLGNEDGRLFLFVMRPEDFQRCREKPGEHHIDIDCSALGRPDVRVLITYSGDRDQARAFIRKLRVKVPINLATESDYCFSGVIGRQKLLGIMLSEYTMGRLELQPMKTFATFKGGEFGIDGVTVRVSYADQDRPVVAFLRQMGIPPEQIAADPALKPMWDRYSKERIDEILDVMTEIGRPLPANEYVSVSMGKVTNFTERSLLAARGAEIAWFARHPTETEYYRHAIPGEFPPDINATYVKVIKSNRPGVRIRIPMTRDADGKFVECHVSARKSVSDTRS